MSWHYSGEFWSKSRSLNQSILKILKLNEWMMHLNSALLWIVVYPKRFTIMGGGGLSSTTTSVQHPLGWCDGCHRTTAPVCWPHTGYRWRGERDIEPIKWMRSPHTSYRWRGGESHMALFHCMVRYGSARLGTERYGSVRVGLHFHAVLVPL